MTQKHRRTGFLLSGIFALSGVGLGVYLFILHLRKIWGFGSSSGICTALSDSGCEIAMGEAGMLFGIPIAVIGLAGALSTTVAAMKAFQKVDDVEHASHALLWGLYLFSVLASLGMGTVSVLDGRFCPVCVIWYGVNLAGFVATWWALGGGITSRVAQSFSHLLTPTGGLLALVFLVVCGGLTAKYHNDVETSEQRKIEQLESQRVQIKKELAEKTAIEVPEFPDAPQKSSQGSEGPLIRIVEFSDIECPFCRRLWTNLEVFLADTPARISLEFIHYPLNKDCNPNLSSQMHEFACIAAKASICAQQQEAFWSFTEAAFGQQSDLEREDLLDLAEELKLDRAKMAQCMDSDATKEKLMKDVARASELGIKGTPTLLINGLKVSGALSPEIFQMVADELSP